MRSGFALALGALVFCGAASAQTVPRIKAVVVGFDGAFLTVMPDGEKDSMKIGVRPATRILKQETKVFSDIQSGDFIGATMTKSPGGTYTAQELHIFPAVLKGSNEGLYAATPGSSRFILDGTVSDTAAAGLTVTFRGAGGEGTKCAGRAPVNAQPGCQGSVTIAVSPTAPVIALAPGDKSLLVPGAVLALSVMAGPDGRPVTPGLTVESLITPPVPLPPLRTSIPRAPAARGPR